MTKMIPNAPSPEAVRVAVEARAAHQHDLREVDWPSISRTMPDYLKRLANDSGLKPVDLVRRGVEVVPPEFVTEYAVENLRHQVRQEEEKSGICRWGHPMR